MKKLHNKICGFMVVRLPHENFDPEGRGAFADKPPIVNNIFYGGIDRMGWFDVDEAFYQGKLRPELMSLRKSLRDTNRDFTGIYLTKDISVAQRLLEYSNEKSIKNEIITVFSEALENIKGSTIWQKEINWIGYDIVFLGNFSLLLEGVFSKPLLFQDFCRLINENGLIEEEKDFYRYIDRYYEVSTKGLVEEINQEPYGLDFMRIGYLK